MLLNEWVEKEKPLNSFVNCDCLNLVKELPINYVDLLLTDLPYNIDNEGKIKFTANGIEEINYKFKKFNIEDLINFIPKLKNNGNIVMFYDAKKCYQIIELFESNNLKFKNYIYYIKNNRGINPRKNFVNKIETAIWFVKNSSYKWNGKGSSVNGFIDSSNELNVPYNCLHPTQKPIKVFEDIIKVFTDENDIVFDPYAGSGVTVKSCLNLNRNYICCEVDKKYYIKANDRIEKDYYIDKYVDKFRKKINENGFLEAK